MSTNPELPTGEITEAPLELPSGEPTAPAKPPRGPNILTRVGRFFMRLFVTLFIGGLLGAAVYYFGLPYLMQGEFMRIDTLELTQTTIDNQIVALEDRIAELETFQTNSGEVLSAAATRQADTDAVQSDLNARLDSVNADLSGLATAEMERQLELQGEVDLIRVMQLLTRARIQLNEDNTGAALTMLSLVEAELGELYAASQSDQVSTIVLEWNARLNKAVLALENDDAFLADSELQSLWASVLRGYDQPLLQTPEPQATATPSP